MSMATQHLQNKSDAAKQQKKCCTFCFSVVLLDHENVWGSSVPVKKVLGRIQSGTLCDSCAAETSALMQTCFLCSVHRSLTQSEVYFHLG